MEYKIRFRRQLQLLISNLIGYFLGIVILGFFVWNANYGDPTETSIIILIALTPIVIPLLMLHLNYFFVDHNQIVTIDKNRSLISIWDSGIEKIYCWDDIDNIIVVKGLHLKNENKSKSVWISLNTPLRVPWSSYGYIKVSFKNKENIILTSLMIDLKEVPFDNYKNQYKLFPIILENKKLKQPNTYKNRCL